MARSSISLTSSPLMSLPRLRPMASWEFLYDSWWRRKNSFRFTDDSTQYIGTNRKWTAVTIQPHSRMALSVMEKRICPRGHTWEQYTCSSTWIEGEKYTVPCVSFGTISLLHHTQWHPGLRLYFDSSSFSVSTNILCWIICNNHRYADDTTLMTESEELKSLLMKVKESGKSWLKTQHSENEDHGIRSHPFMANRWENNGNSDRLYFGGLQNHCRWWL